VEGRDERAAGRELGDLACLTPGSHVCWVLDAEASLAEAAAACLLDGNERGEKTVLFAPHDTVDRPELRRLAKIAADPRELIDQRRLNPHTLLGMFREQLGIARMEGYEGLRVLADTDWVLPVSPTLQEMIAFEVLLERVIADAGATAICAYRQESFERHAIAGALCLHPLRFGTHEQPSFTLLAGAAGAWRLSGEVDLAVLEAFDAAFAAAAREPCVVDVSELRFIDLGGMRTIAEHARSADTSIQLRGARTALRHVWRLAGFDRMAPSVELVT
jgi:anti-anti-sigma regulatory factor